MSRKTAAGSERHLTPAERRRRHAEAGDVQAIWAELTDKPWTLLDLSEMFRLLLVALEVAGREDPAALSEQLFGRMVAFTGCLTLRSHYLIGRIFAGHDSNTNGGRAALFLPRDLTSEHLAQILELQGHLSQLLETEARVARLWGLTRRSESPPARRRRLRSETQDAAAVRGGPSPNGAARRTSHPEITQEVGRGTDD